jgi:site-specific recombinase XerD
MLHDYIRYLGKTNRKKTLANLDIVSVREFVVHEQGRGLSPYSVQGKVRVLKVFSSWLFNEGYTSENILLALKVPKAPLNLIEPLTDQEIEKILGYQNPLTALGSRNIAIFVLLLDSGLRVSELCSLKYEDAHIEEGYLKVFGKGSKERIVPIGALSQKTLWRYVFHSREYTKAAAIGRQGRIDADFHGKVGNSWLRLVFLVVTNIITHHVHLSSVLLPRYFWQPLHLAPRLPLTFGMANLPSLL